jgi:hypothetical protein
MAPGAGDLAGRHSVYDERFEKVYQQLPGKMRIGDPQLPASREGLLD